MKTPDENATQLLCGPAWTIENEYPSFDSDVYIKDQKAVEQLFSSLEACARALEPSVSRAGELDPIQDHSCLEICLEMIRVQTELSVILDTMGAYANCVLAVDACHDAAKKARSAISVSNARFSAALSSLSLIVAYASEGFYHSLVDHPDALSYRFHLEKKRKQRARKLSLDVEKTIATFGPDGFTAWGQLYDNLTGSMKCEVAGAQGDQTLGLSQAAALLRRDDRGVRENAWRAINAAFAGNSESCAAMLNAIAGWRHTEYGLRSHREPVHFLDEALEKNNIGRASLEAMNESVKAARETGRRAVRAQARLLGIATMAPWDLLAEPPGTGTQKESLDFEHGFALVREAYASVSERMATFVDYMKRERFIEGRAISGKRPGAFCTSFPKSGTTRVFQTYQGSLPDVSTLAHELGHAFHSYVMRDLPYPQRGYPMALAETASTFAEAALSDTLARRAKSPQDRLSLGWSEAQDAAAFLLNIPSRLEFEQRFYERRKLGPLSPADLSLLMRDSWQYFYGDALCEYDDSFWMSKLHFYKTGISFYNFPYTFGYLFSLGLYAKRAELGEKIIDAYESLLRDTGRMTVEELARKHLGVDLTEREFWDQALSVVEGKVSQFEAMLDDRRI